METNEHETIGKFFNYELLDDVVNSKVDLIVDYFTKAIMHSYNLLEKHVCFVCKKSNRPNIHEVRVSNRATETDLNSIFFYEFLK